jgi:hypothetical protein
MSAIRIRNPRIKPHALINCFDIMSAARCGPINFLVAAIHKNAKFAGVPSSKIEFRRPSSPPHVQVYSNDLELM